MNTAPIFKIKHKKTAPIFIETAFIVKFVFYLVSIPVQTNEKFPSSEVPVTLKE